MDSKQSDFIPAAELARLQPTRKLKTLYDDYSKGTGPYAAILTKFGGRLGVWRPDYEAWLKKQLKLRDAA